MKCTCSAIAMSYPFLVTVVPKVQVVFVAAATVVVVALSPLVEIVPVPSQGRRPARRPLLLLPPPGPRFVPRPPVVTPVPPVRVHVLPANIAAHVAVPAAVLVETQRVLLLPASVEAGADGDVVRPLEARGLEADVNLNGFEVNLKKNLQCRQQ